MSDAVLSEALTYAAERRAFLLLDLPPQADTVAEAKQWLTEEKDHLVQKIQTHIGATALDGGMPAQGFASHLSGKKWASFVRQFLLT